MKKYDFDLFVIGAGSGGVRAARVAADYGARVAIAEFKQFGGTCVNAGCVPKKLFYYGSSYGPDFSDARGFGWDIKDPHFNWQTLVKNKDREISRLNEIYRNLLQKAGVQIISGKAVLAGPNNVRINDHTYSTERILLATGGQPVLPDIPGAQYCISSDQAFHLETLPSKIIIVGGGYIALEFAGIFNGLGVETMLVMRGALPLRGLDNEIRARLVDEIRKQGVRLLLNTNVYEIEPQNDGFRVNMDNHPQETASQVMYAIGRRPCTTGMDLEQQGVKLGPDGSVITDRHYQTTIPSIYAIGDVSNSHKLTPVAIAEGMALAKSLYGNLNMDLDYQNIPTCIFSQPNVATVGLSEEQARLKFMDIAVYRSSFRPMKHTMTGRNEKTLMKLVVDKGTDRVVGAHMIGMDAGEIMQGIAIAINAGATKAQFDSTLGIHPTAAEEFVTMKQADL